MIASNARKEDLEMKAHCLDMLEFAANRYSVDDDPIWPEQITFWESELKRYIDLIEKADYAERDRGFKRVSEILKYLFK